MSQKSKKMNRKGRREITQRALDLEFRLHILCNLYVRTLRFCGKKTFKTVFFFNMVVFFDYLDYFCRSLVII